MPKLKRIMSLLLALIVCLGMLTGCGQTEETQEEEARIGGFTVEGRIEQGEPEEAEIAGVETQERANITLMIYIVGSDLESSGGAASSDIGEMINSGFDFERGNILLMTGGSRAWLRSSGISAEELGIYKVGSRGIEKVSSSPLASMGQPGTLAAFLDFCYTSYPAESYGLILWDHGGGPMAGYGNDELYGDVLTLAELTEGLEESPFGPENKLAFLGFDACLMSSAEVAWSLRDYASYMIASEEVIPGKGWDYGFLSELNGAPLDGEAAGRAIIDSYAAYYERAMAGQSMLNRLTLACVDLSEAEEMEAALDALFRVMTADLAAGKYSQIVQFRQNSLPFAKYTTDSDYDLIDLADLADNLAEEHPQEAAALREAVEDMVVYAWSPLERAHGLTLYYPFDNKAYYSALWGELYPSFGFAPEYTAFMSQFAQEWLSGSSGSWRSGSLPPLEQDEETDAYYIQLSEEQAADYLEGSYYILRQGGNGEYLVCGVRKDVTLDAQNRLHADFGGESVYVANDLGESFPAIYFDYSESGNQDLHLSAMLHDDPWNTPVEEFQSENVWFLISMPENGESVPLQTAIARQGNNFYLLDVLKEENELNPLAYGKEELQISDFPYVYFDAIIARETRNEADELLPVSQWQVDYGSIWGYYDSTDHGWRAEQRQLGDDGRTYYIQIVAKDVYGQEYGSELIPVPLTEKGERRRAEMFADSFFPLAEKDEPLPELPPVEELYYSLSPFYQEIPVEEQLIMDDPSGIRMTLVTAFTDTDYEGNARGERLILILRVDDDSRYFDSIYYRRGEEYGFRLGDQKAYGYFGRAEIGSEISFELDDEPMLYGASYYYYLELSEWPADADTLTCYFMLWQSKWDPPENLYYWPAAVEIPLPEHP